MLFKLWKQLLSDYLINKYLIVHVMHIKALYEWEVWIINNKGILLWNTTKEKNLRN